MQSRQWSVVRRWSSVVVPMTLRRGSLAAACAAFALLTAGPAAGAGESPNLLANGDAEVGDVSPSGYSAVSLPGWEVTAGTPTVIPYGAASDFPPPSQGPPDGGNQFFGGGFAGNATLRQSVDLAAAAVEIDGGTVSFTLSGWLGGSQKDRSDAKVTVRFLDANDQQLGVAAIGPVTRADRRHRTRLLQRSTSGTIPVGTRRASVVMSLANRSRGVYNHGFADELSLTVSAALPAPPPPSPPPSTVGALDHVFLVVLAAKGVGDIVGSPQAPYINSLIDAYGFASDHHALTHPRDPNTIALLGGSDFGIRTNCSLSCTVDEPHLLDNLETSGQTWAFYAESMPSPCYPQSAGPYYTPNQLPWVYVANLADDPARCQAHVRPLGEMSAALQSSATTPNFVWFQPDACDSMELCGVAAGDSWLQQTLQQILFSNVFQDPTERSAVFITWDEDQNQRLRADIPGNQVPLIVIPSPGAVDSGMRSGPFVATAYANHYSLLRTIEEALGLPSLTNNDRYATPLNDFWQ